MNYDENGGYSTTENSYEQGKAAAKLKGEGVSRLASAASNALTASGHPILGKGAKMLGNNLAKQNAQSNSGEEGQEQGNELVNNAIEKGASTAAKAAGVPAPLANAAGKVASNLANNEKVKNAQKTIKRVKLLWKLSPFIGVFLGILFIVALISVAINGADQALDKLISFGESYENFVTFNGFNSNTVEIQQRIDAAAGECSDCLFSSNINNNTGLDKGILIATVDNAVVVGPGSYSDDDSSNDTEKSEADYADGSSFIILDKWNTHAFYTMKLNMLGQSNDPGTMIYSLMGEEITVTCADPADVDKKENFRALKKYFLNGALTGVDIGIGFPKRVLENVVKSFDNAASYATEDSNYLIASGREIAFGLKDDNVASAVIEDMTNMLDQMDACSKDYVLNADGTKKMKNGNPVMKSAKLEAVKINDYKQYFNYIAKVYTPTMYSSTWGSLTTEQKIRLAKNVWADIVAARNDYYGVDGNGSYLSYQFDLDGNLVAEVSGSTVAGGSYGYMSNIPVGTAGIGWRQNKSPWSNFQLGSATCVTSKGYPCNMGSIGCYITSIAILMANSGTQINSPTFDPGVLAATLKANGAISSGGSTTRFSWANLAPNFNYVKNAYTSGLVPQQIFQFLNEGLEVMVHVDGHHWVAVVGVENGRVLIADPWDYGNNPGTVYLDSWKYKNVDIVSGFRASDKH